MIEFFLSNKYEFTMHGSGTLMLRTQPHSEPMTSHAAG